MATHFNMLDWRIPWIEELGRLQSMGLQKSGTTQQLNHPHHLTIYLVFVPSFPFLTHSFSVFIWVMFYYSILSYLFFFFILSFHAFCGSYVNYSMHPLFKTVVCLEGYFMNNLRSFNFLSSPLRSCYTFHSSSCQSLYLHIHLSSINNALQVSLFSQSIIFWGN